MPDSKSLIERVAARVASFALKYVSGISFDAVSAGWYLRNGYPQIYSILTGGMPAWSGEAVSVETALNHSVVWACNRIISESIGYIPAILMQADGETKRSAVNHPMYGAMKMAPNDEISAQGFTEQMTSHCLLQGNAYAQIIRRSGTGIAMELHALLPQFVYPDREKGGQKRLVYVIKDGESPEKTYTLQPGKPHDLLHLRGLGWDGIRGYSVITMGRQSIGSAIAAERNTARFWAYGGRIPYVLKLDKPFKTDQDFEKFRDDWEKIYAEPQRAPILEPWVDYKPIGLNMKDAQALETRQYTVAEICRWFSVSPHLVQDLSHATFCLPAGTKIFTPKGPQDIENLRAGDPVWSWDEAAKSIIKSPVEQAGCTGYDEILLIKTNGRAIRTNAKHKFLVWREALEPFKCGKGQIIKIDGKCYRKKYEYTWIPAGELMIGDYLVAAERLPDCDGDQAPTRTATVEFMEILGMLLGNGFYWRSPRNGNGYGFGISHAENASYLAHYKTAIERLFLKCKAGGFLPKEERQLYPLKASIRDKNTTMFYSAFAYEEFERCGMIGTAKTKHVPSWIFELNRNLKLAFLRGYLDSDGTIMKNGSARFASVNRELLESIRHLCISAGLRVGNIFSSQIKSDFGGRKTYSHVLYGIQMAAAEAKSIWSHTILYQERIARALEKPKKDRRSRKYHCESSQNIQDFGLRRTRIESIEKTLTLPIYNLSVNGTHNYIADGLIVKNSNIEHLALDFVKMTLSTWMSRWEQDFWRCVLTPEEKAAGYFLHHNVNALLRGDFKTRMDGYASALQNGHMNIDEVRDLEDRNPLPNGAGSHYHIQLNMQALPEGKHQEQEQESAAVESQPSKWPSWLRRIA